MHSHDINPTTPFSIDSPLFRNENTASIPGASEATSAFHKITPGSRWFLKREKEEDCRILTVERVAATGPRAKAAGMAPIVVYKSEPAIKVPNPENPAHEELLWIELKDWIDEDTTFLEYRKPKGKKPPLSERPPQVKVEVETTPVVEAK